MNNFLEIFFLLFFNTIGIYFPKNRKIFFQKSMKYGLFCSKFFTDHFYEVHFGPSGPTYAVELILEILFFLLF